MQLIDVSYFIGEIAIANTDQDAVSDGLEYFIKKYEKRFLKFLLGDFVYNSFMEGLEQDPVLPEWTELSEKLVDVDMKESPIANYVYYFYMRDNATVTVGLGEAKAKAENATMVNNTHKIVRAWNEMCDFVIGSREWFHDWYAEYDFPHEEYHYNIYCYESYKDEFAKKNSLGL